MKTILNHRLSLPLKRSRYRNLFHCRQDDKKRGTQTVSHVKQDLASSHITFFRRKFFQHCMANRKIITTQLSHSSQDQIRVQPNKVSVRQNFRHL